MTLPMNHGNTSKEHCCFNVLKDFTGFFKTLKDVPKDFTGYFRLNDGIYFYKDGEPHREDGPAVKWDDGEEKWFIHGLRHHVDGPAYITKQESAWYINDLLHRTDGPAIERANGRKEWYINDQFHRTDGPAIEKADGSKEWYLNDEQYGEDDDFTNESWKHFQKTLIF